MNNEKEKKMFMFNAIFDYSNYLFEIIRTNETNHDQGDTYIVRS